jgi:hypothetical protein
MLTISKLKRAFAALFAIFFCLAVGRVSPTQTQTSHQTPPRFVKAVLDTKPLAYYRLQTASGKSEAGNTSYQAHGRVTIVAKGGPITDPAQQPDPYAQLDGTTGYILTTQNGGVGNAASIMAWVNLASLPRTPNKNDGNISYLAGESQSGNDLDLQFESDNALRFFTAGGGAVAYKPNLATLAGHWHMIVVTFATGSNGARQIFWDGRLVASDTGGGTPNKIKPFSIGNSTYFTPRFLHGGVAEAALWSRVLSAQEVASIYAASEPLPPSAPKPAAKK